jgi:hypothetical protein
LYSHFLEYFKLTPEEANAQKISQSKFTRYFKRDYKEVIQKQKKIDGKPELCFFNVRLKTEAERWKDSPPAKPTAPPPDDNPF